MAFHFRTEYLVQKIEVDRAIFKGEASLSWGISFVPYREGASFLLGNLKVQVQRGLGQVLVFAILNPLDDTFAGQENFDDIVLAWAQEQCVVPLYEVARRALETQAAQMDFTFDLSSAPPHSRVTRVRAPDSEESPR